MVLNRFIIPGFLSELTERWSNIGCIFLISVHKYLIFKMYVVFLWWQMSAIFGGSAMVGQTVKRHYVMKQ